MLKIYSRRFPNWDISRSTPSIELIRAQDELNTANNKLHDKQLWYLEKRKELDAQWVDIENKEIKLKKAFKSFNKVIRKRYLVEVLELIIVWQRNKNGEQTLHTIFST